MFENMDRLKSFYYVYSQGSVVDAARSLHVSQSAVSQAIQKLEGELKTPLFIRQHKQLIPTSAGERLFAVVQPFIDDLHICMTNLEHSRNQPFGELRIGAPPEFGKEYLPAIMASFRKEYPEVSFHLKFGSPNALVPLVKTGKIHLALVDVFLTDNQLLEDTSIYHFEPIVEEIITLACSQKYYTDSFNGEPSLAVLAQQDFIEYKRDSYTIKKWFKHHYGKSKVPFRTVLTVDSHAAIMSAIKHHVGMGVVATHLIDKEIQSGRIIPISTPQEHIVNQISLIQLKDKIPTLTEKVFEKHLIERIHKLNI